MKIPVLLLLAAMFAGATACQSEGDGWRGVVRDSAGIRIVENPVEGLLPPDRLPRVEEDLRIGTLDGPGEYQFGAIADLAVADNGEIYVLDGLAREVRVYDAEGTFLRSMGRPGGGPGELGEVPRAILLGPGDTVIVHDAYNGRAVLFTREGEPAGVFRVPDGADQVAIRLASLPDGRVVQQTRWPIVSSPSERPPPDKLLVRRLDGTVEDTLFTMPAGASMLVSPDGRQQQNFFAVQPHWEIDARGGLYFAMTSDYRVEYHSREGRLETVITRPVEPSPVTEEVRHAVLDFLRESMERGGMEAARIQRRLDQFGFGDTLPVFNRMVPGPRGTLWVQQSRTGQDIVSEGYGTRATETPRWDVYDPEGRLLGSVLLPEGIVPQATVGDAFYAIWRDDLEVNYVVRLRVTGFD